MSQEVHGCLPLLLLDGLLSQGHVLHVFLQSVERRVGFHAYTVVVILGVAPARREANENADERLTRAN